MFFSKDEKNPIKRALQGELLQNEPFIQLCTKIENYLMDTEAVNEQLIELNEQLTMRLKEKGLKPGEKGATKQLRTLIQEILTEAGFREGMLQTIGNKPLKKEDFMFLVSSGFMLKDSSLRASSHGELTHAIQWCLIILKQKKDSNFLENIPINEICDRIYKKLGHKDSSNPSHPFTCWDVLIDKLGEEDSRSPEWLSEHIQNDESQIFPVLREVIKNRTEKGQTEENKEKLQKKLENPPEHYEKHEDIENLLMPQKK
ncbi:TPA: Dot/Icm T4SS effector LirA [Legionella pneumophila]|nr:Dot/Icm T4SS effector LirA [Legionella pneumophila]HAU1847164.1 Dot/Icm T4SS effector LirA [Legionella pneumophila]